METAKKILRRISASAFMSSEKEALEAMEEYAQYKVNKLNKADVRSSLPYLKVSRLLSAMNDIRNWDDDLEDKWEDTGYRAKAALAEYYEGND